MCSSKFKSQFYSYRLYLINIKFRINTIPKKRKKKKKAKSYFVTFLTYNLHFSGEAWKRRGSPVHFHIKPSYIRVHGTVTSLAVLGPIDFSVFPRVSIPSLVRGSLFFFPPPSFIPFPPPSLLVGPYHSPTFAKWIIIVGDFERRSLT